jgi:hypothetical protein
MSGFCHHSLRPEVTSAASGVIASMVPWGQLLLGNRMDAPVSVQNINITAASEPIESRLLPFFVQIHAEACFRVSVHIPWIDEQIAAIKLPARF